ncbi:efflux transporter outer membrane subunit [Undibacterium sp. SXout7W]|uniref:efflux transporter outer membrane subunit n=1 Tax=Undibacterium sp. SXout7W TaxID=3413049 RepID=UPI003BF0D338
MPLIKTLTLPSQTTSSAASTHVAGSEAYYIAATLYELSCKFRWRYWSLVLSCLASMQLITGCAVGPDYVRPDVKLPANYVADTFRSQVGSSPMSTLPVSAGQNIVQDIVQNKDIPAMWWELFHSRQLNELITEGLKHNPTVEAAQASLRSAAENMAAQQAAFFPTVEATFSPTRQKVAGTLASPASSGAAYYNLHTAQVTVSYTPDIFGANRRQVESQKAQAEIQRFQLEASYLTLTTNIVNTAITEAALREQIKATRQIVASQQALLDMLEQQYRLGQASKADIAAQEALLAASQASLPGLEKQLAAQRTALATLTGQYASDDIDVQFNLDQLTLPTPLPLALPAMLVEQRPDIRAAEEALRSASAQIGVSIANRLPNVTLGMNAYGSASHSVADLFTSGTGFWTLAGNVVQPIFDGGALRHRQNAAEATFDQTAALYRSTVLNAFQNVVDALHAIQYDGVAASLNLKAEQAAEKSLSIARHQLQLGDISRLSLLSSEQAFQQARISSIQARANQLTDTVALFQALGGGWWNRKDETTYLSTK